MRDKMKGITLQKAGDPGGIQGLMQYLDYGFYPVNAPSTLITPNLWRGRISGAVWPDLVERHKVESLRKLAKEYNVSHEAIRRTLDAESSKK